MGLSRLCPTTWKMPNQTRSAGTFLGYTATEKNIIYIDEHTHKVKPFSTIHQAQLSPAIIPLQDVGYHGDLNNEATPTPSNPTAMNGEALLSSPLPACNDAFYVKSLSIHATIPT
jgi:hypothetical protein